MRDIKNIFCISAFLCCLALPCYAQVLDDSVAEDSDEELFNEMFSDYSETEKDVTKAEKFDDIMEQAGSLIKQAKIKVKKEEAGEESTVDNTLPPVEGELYIGVAKGSFKTYTDLRGKAACSFDVVLKSTLNRNIKTLGLHLSYPKRTFAFMFFELKEGAIQKQTIRTSGDICYNLTGVPDINIHKCKIYGAPNKECAQRMKWDDTLTNEGAVRSRL